MALENSYATLTELLAFMPNSTNTDTSMANNSLMAASRAIDRQTGTYFYPQVKTNLYDTPTKDKLNLYDDLLELTTLTNGDGDEITSSYYKLYPYNSYPKFMIKLNPLGNVWFETSSTWDEMAAIQVLGFWGFHDNYTRAWTTESSLSAAVATTSVTTITASADFDFEAGHIIRIDNELMQITAVDSSTVETLTVIRGWNGSTAATHLINASIKVWHPMEDIKRACLIQATRYLRRSEAPFGTIGGGELGAESITIPKLDPFVQELVNPYRSQF